MTDAVVGVGNPLMGDDGISQAVIDELIDTGIDTRYDVTVTHAGTTAMLALEAMSGADRAIVVDAVAADAEPGSIHRFRYEGGDLEEFDDVLMHDFSFADALTAGASAYDLPETVVMIGVVPETVEPDPTLSDRLRNRLPAVVETVLTELNMTPGDETANEAPRMKVNWYCADCDESIDSEEVADHEDDGHEVKGQMRPERLLQQDPSTGTDDSVTWTHRG